MNFYKEIEKLKNKIKCCCQGIGIVTLGYDTPTDAQNDITLANGSFYYITGNVPGVDFKGNVYVKLPAMGLNGYDDPGQAQNDATLPIGKMYYLTGNTPGAGNKGEVYVKY